eukprot:CAMPEP_0197828942 /NCGR_PEP_ID=MMETSP1437-20131217/5433_1 /TAXON_ID=49252 ORGANISM="Eucampia antarctica, Strain CCMP1452" /NCGR_SAMPLE_ID=MMETSP1437 /ASSEMBLY_ACC=CAM_ASM_001096 /LENGTH=281 /DNA_ID=CAMNT_0043430369 /DNA_START=50 /DNA_END=895 /DNA_ORIENTATION=+
MMLLQSKGLQCLVLLLFTVGNTDGRQSVGGSGGLMSRNAGSESGPIDLFDPGTASADGQASRLAGITRGWSVPPLNREKLVQACGSESGHYVANLLGNRPLSFKLLKKQIRNPGGGQNEKFFRAQAALGSGSRRKNLRSIWTTGTGLSKRSVPKRAPQAKELLGNSYEDAISRLYTDRLEVEILLPRVGAKKKSKTSPPAVVYSFPMGQGMMNEKGSVGRGRGTVFVFPNGRKKMQGAVEEPKCIEVDTTTFNLHSGPSVIDHAWAKGKKTFWKGRKVGQF